jgi:REP element-mobilizing transposase RayT
LRQPRIAELVRDAIELHQPHAWVIMPNHVHVLWTPAGSLAALIGKVKGSTAHAANLILGTTGEPFWQDDYFDRLVRDDTFEDIRRYIECNPVKAGLAMRP